MYSQAQPQITTAASILILMLTILGVNNSTSQTFTSNDIEPIEKSVILSHSKEASRTSTISSTQYYKYAGLDGQLLGPQLFTNPYGMNICVKFEFVLPSGYSPCQNPGCCPYCPNNIEIDGDVVPSWTWVSCGTKYFTKYLCLAPGDHTITFEVLCYYRDYNNYVRITIDEDHDCASPGGACSSW